VNRIDENERMALVLESGAQNSSAMELRRFLIWNSIIQQKVASRVEIAARVLEER
jgi:hypothetical protein